MVAHVLLVDDRQRGERVRVAQVVRGQAGVAVEVAVEDRVLHREASGVDRPPALPLENDLGRETLELDVVPEDTVPVAQRRPALDLEDGLTQ